MFKTEVFDIVFNSQGFVIYSFEGIINSFVQCSILHFKPPAAFHQILHIIYTALVSEW